MDGNTHEKKRHRRGNAARGGKQPEAAPARDDEASWTGADQVQKPHRLR